MDEKFIKYPSIDYLSDNPEILDKDVKVYEKLDGANCQFRMLYDGKIQPGSRSKKIGRQRSKSAFTWKKDFLGWVNEELRTSIYMSISNRGYNDVPVFSSLLDPKYIFFGEWLSTHTKTYPSKYRDDFYLIDIMDIEDKRFIDYEEAKEIVDHYGLKINTMNKIYEGILDHEKIDDLMEGSDYGVERKEGIVIKNYEMGKDFRDQIKNFAKYVDPEFAEMRDKIDYHDSILIEEIAKEFVKENYDDVKSFIEESSQDNSKNMVDSVVEEISGRGIIEGYFDFKNGDFDLYNKRFIQALKVFVKEKEQIL